MDAHTAEQRDSALVAAGWPRVLDRLLQGIGHDLNNRVQTLLSLVQLLELDEDVSSLSPFLSKEVALLEAAVSLARMIPEPVDETPELIHLPEVLPEFVRLHSIQKGLEPVERSLELEAEGLMPIRAPWTYLGRCILVFLAAAAEEALGRGGVVVVSLAVEDGQVLTEATVGGECTGDELPPATATPSGIQDVAGLLNGSFEVHDRDGIRTFRLRLPMVTRPGG